MTSAGPPNIDAATRYCAVYGFPIRHSASPAMQNAGLAALGLNWRYLAFEVRPEWLRQAIEGAKSMDFIGLNLTVPHKLLALEIVDVADADARMWGAVNTIRFEGRNANGEWRPIGEWTVEKPMEIRSHGFNTDAEGIVRSLREDLGVEVKGATGLVLGAGGAGRVAALKLASEGIQSLYLMNRTREKVDAVAQEIARRYPNIGVKVGYPAGDVDFLLNATSLGLKASDPIPLNDADFNLRQAGAVYDMIYRPSETPLLRKARECGCRTANGIGMLLWQGVRALELWTGKIAPVEVMRKALMENIYGPI